MTFFVEQLSTTRDEVTRIGEAKTLEGAIELAKGTIDEYLERHSYYNASADALYTRYQESGIIPCIFCDHEESLNVRNFDHLHYAALQCVKAFEEEDSLMLPIASMELMPRQYARIGC